VSEFLVFTLYGPFASWGTIAVGEVRDSDVIPTRSAILGLLAASLGIRRDEPARLQALSSAVGIAVVVEADGIALEDYHTAQTLPARMNGQWHIRGEEITLGEEHDALETVLSWRSYRCDALYRIAVWARAAEPSLSAIGKALSTPFFVLSLGRRACVLGAPLAARIVDGATIEEAIGAYEHLPELHPLVRRLRTLTARRHGSTRLLAADVGAPMAATATLEVTRRDQPVERRGDRWFFEDRREQRVSLAPG
jgi:CRISPR system Cascade subunit CasD